MNLYKKFPKKSKIKIIIAIPSSILENSQDLRSKTEKLGIIARAAAIFKIEKILIYPHSFKKKENREKDNLKFLKLILDYLECPPYFRKKMFPLSPLLKFCGTLPPLKISHHLFKKTLKNLEFGELREGLIINSNRNFSIVDIGLSESFRLKIPNLKINKRITLFLKKNNSELNVSIVDPKDIVYYWGYKVLIKDLKEILKIYKNFCIILTSKYGKSINEYFEPLTKIIYQNPKILIIFGAPFEGLHKIFKKKEIKINKKIIELNMIPNQGTETITTEEAILGTLSVLNFIFYTN
ncbi:MAG: putative RNA uridine N3 methyltransferase [Candidatus Helarchaeota archaeon]